MIAVCPICQRWVSDCAGGSTEEANEWFKDCRKQGLIFAAVIPGNRFYSNPCVSPCEGFKVRWVFLRKRMGVE